MIFVAVGNHPQGFVRLLKSLDVLAKDKIINDVFVQIGYSNYRPKYCVYTKFVGFNEFHRLIKKSDMVITHSGAGSILNALMYNKPTIVVPRLKKYREHTDDHQLQIAKALEKEGKIIAVYNIKDLENAIKKARIFRPKTAKKKSSIIELIENYLTEIGLIPE